MISSDVTLQLIKLWNTILHKVVESVVTVAENYWADSWIKIQLDLQNTMTSPLLRQALDLKIVTG